MHELPPKQIIVAAAAAGAAVLILTFLMPRGEILAYLSVCLAAAAGLAKLYTFLYALSQSEPEIPAEEGFAPSIDLYVVGSAQSVDDVALSYPRVRIIPVEDERTVAAEILSGKAPLIAILKKGEVPHPEFISTLVPYFSDTTLAFVQAATRYDGTGGIADAFRAQESLVAMEQVPRASLGAVTLRGSASLIARDALEDAYYPGITWEKLGLSMQAVGYSARFEPRALVLAWAPRTLSSYCRRMLDRGMAAWRILPKALAARGLSFAGRMQYVGDALAHAAGALGGVGLVWSGAALLYRGVGPFIIGRSFIVTYICLAIVSIMAFRYLARATGGRLSPALLLFIAGAFPAHAAVLAGRRADAYVRSIDTKALAMNIKRVWALAIAREGENAGSAPAGSPARS